MTRASVKNGTVAVTLAALRAKSGTSIKTPPHIASKPPKAHSSGQIVQPSVITVPEEVLVPPTSRTVTVLTQEYSLPQQGPKPSVQYAEIATPPSNIVPQPTVEPDAVSTAFLKIPPPPPMPADDSASVSGEVLKTTLEHPSESSKPEDTSSIPAPSVARTSIVGNVSEYNASRDTAYGSQPDASRVLTLTNNRKSVIQHSDTDQQPTWFYLIHAKSENEMHYVPFASDVSLRIEDQYQTHNVGAVRPCVLTGHMPVMK